MKSSTPTTDITNQLLFHGQVRRYQAVLHHPPPGLGSPSCTATRKVPEPCCPAPTPPQPLTFLPMHLLTGFMRKEERKPLKYITRGMVAMNFCCGKGGGGQRGLPGRRDGVHATRPPTHLGQAERICQVHGNVGLRQVHDEPCGHVQHAHLRADRQGHRAGVGVG